MTHDTLRMFFEDAGRDLESHPNIISRLDEICANLLRIRLQVDNFGYYEILVSGLLADERYKKLLGDDWSRSTWVRKM